LVSVIFSFDSTCNITFEYVKRRNTYFVTYIVKEREEEEEEKGEEIKRKQK